MPPALLCQPPWHPEGHSHTGLGCGALPSPFLPCIRRLRPHLHPFGGLLSPTSVLKAVPVSGVCEKPNPAGRVRGFGSAPARGRCGVGQGRGSGAGLWASPARAGAGMLRAPLRAHGGLFGVSMQVWGRCWRGSSCRRGRARQPRWPCSSPARAAPCPAATSSWWAPGTASPSSRRGLRQVGAFPAAPLGLCVPAGPLWLCWDAGNAAAAAGDLVAAPAAAQAGWGQRDSSCPV